MNLPQISFHCNLATDFPLSNLVGNLSETSVGSNAGDNGAVGGSRSNVLSGEIGEEAGGGGAESTGRTETVDLASVSKIGGAGCVGAGRWSSEELTVNRRFSDDWNVLENVALSDDVGTGTDLERVSRVVVPVVVNGVKDGVSLNLWRTSRSMVDVVTLHGDHIVGTIEIDTPVVVSVTSGRVIRDTVDVVVGESNTVGSERTKNDVLTGNVVSGDVINPDHVGAVDGNGVSSPDVLRVDLFDLDVSGSRVSMNLTRMTLYTTYWIMMLLAPETMRRPFPWMIPVEPSPIKVLSEATEIPRTPALS